MNMWSLLFFDFGRVSRSASALPLWWTESSSVPTLTNPSALQTNGGEMWKCQLWHQHYVFILCPFTFNPTGLSSPSAPSCSACVCVCVYLQRGRQQEKASFCEFVRETFVTWHGFELSALVVVQLGFLFLIFLRFVLLPTFRHEITTTSVRIAFTLIIFIQ